MTEEQCVELAGATLTPDLIRAERTYEPVPLARTTTRLDNLDVARVIAALGVIWLHANEYHAWGTLGLFRVPFFTILGVFLTSRSILRRPESLGDLARKRTMRLLVPFVVWSIVYGAFRYFLTATGRTPVTDVDGGSTTLFYASAGVHLWFLPFILMASLAAGVFTRVTARLPQRTLLVVCTALACLAAWHMFSVPYHKFTGYTRFYDAVWSLTACMLLGTALAMIEYSLPSLKIVPSWKITAVFAALWGTCIYLTVKQMGPSNLTASISGLALLLAGIYLPKNRWARWIGTFGKYTFGTYLVHVFFIRLMERLGLETMMGETAGGLIRFGAAAVLSFLVVAVLFRISFIRPFVGGTSG